MCANLWYAAFFILLLILVDLERIEYQIYGLLIYVPISYLMVQYLCGKKIYLPHMVNPLEKGKDLAARFLVFMFYTLAFIASIYLLK